MGALLEIARNCSVRGLVHILPIYIAIVCEYNNKPVQSVIDCRAALYSYLYDMIHYINSTSTSATTGGLVAKAVITVVFC